MIRISNFELTRAALYYYNLLSSNEKAIYSAMLNAMLNVSPAVKLPCGSTKEAVSRIIHYISNDRPDLFWPAHRYKTSSINGIVDSVSFEYRMSKAEAEVMKSRIVNSTFYRQLDNLLSSKRTSFEKALAAYEYIIKNAEYDLRAAATEPRYNYYAFHVDGVILNSKAVCEGYAKTFQYFMNKHGVYCTLVTGRTSRGGHAWNLINLDGSYYYVDATWGDPVFANGEPKSADFVSYDFFCFTTNEMNASHNAVLDTKMPLCNDTRYNYYKYFNMISQSFSANDIVSRIISAYRKGEKEAVIRYSSAAAYSTAKRELFDNKKIFSVLSDAKRTIPAIDNHNVKYSTNADQRTIKIKFL